MSTVVDAERYLTDVLGGASREALGLGPSVTGFHSEGAPGVSITHAPRDTQLEWAGEPGPKLELFGPGKHSGEVFSFAMKLSLEELRASFVAEDASVMYRDSSYTFERALEEFRVGERTPLESFR